MAWESLSGRAVCRGHAYPGPQLYCFALRPSEGLGLALCPAGGSVRPFCLHCALQFGDFPGHKHCSLHQAIARDAALFTWWEASCPQQYGWRRLTHGAALWPAPASPDSWKLCGFFSQSVVLPEEAPRLRGRETRVMPGPSSAVDTRPRWLRAGSQEALSLGRPLAGPEDVAVCVEGARSAAAPSTGVQGRCWARRGAGVPS